MILKMKSLLCLLFVMCVTATGFAAPSVQSTADANADSQWVRPNLKIFNNNTSPMNMVDYTVAYYFYEEDLDLNTLSASVWSYGLGSEGDVTVTIVELDPEYTSGEKKANSVALINFATGTLEAGASVDVSLAFRKADWGEFDLEDDWSYMVSNGFQDNENLVIKDDTGVVVFGNEPGDGGPTRPYSTPIYWLGAHTQAEMDAITLNEGDAYRNTEDGKAYVNYEDNWMVLDDNTLSGGQMADSNSHINMNGSNVVNAGTVESTTATVTGSVTAGNFVGDGSSLTNLQLEDGSVLFDHLNQSTLDALVAYIAARIVVPQSNIGVVASPSGPTFELHRTGNTSGAVLVSYTIFQMSGAVYTTGNALFADGETMKLVDAYPGATLTVTNNPTIYHVDPAAGSATLTPVTLSASVFDADDNRLHIGLEYPVHESFTINYVITRPDGATNSQSLTWPGSSSTGVVIQGDYADKITLLPGTGYVVNSAAREAQLQKIELSMEVWDEDSHRAHLRLDHPVEANTPIRFDYRVTRRDGTAADRYIMWSGGTSNGVVFDLDYGDKVELLPSAWYDINPAAPEVEFPIVELFMEVWDEDSHRAHLRLEHPVEADTPIRFDYRVTRRDGTAADRYIMWSGGTSNGVVFDLDYGDKVELLPSAWYDINPAAPEVEFPIVELSMEVWDEDSHRAHLRLDHPVEADTPIRFDYRVTRRDGTAADRYIMWSGGTSNGVVFDLDYGDKVELLPSAWYDINPAAPEVEFPIVELSMEIWDFAAHQVHLRLENPFETDVPIRFDYRIQHSDGTSVDRYLMWPGGTSNGVILDMTAGDRVELVASDWYTINPTAAWAQL